MLARRLEVDPPPKEKEPAGTKRKAVALPHPTPIRRAIGLDCLPRSGRELDWLCQTVCGSALLAEEGCLAHSPAGGPFSETHRRETLKQILVGTIHMFWVGSVPR